jgi:hypothetical protein
LTQSKNKILNLLKLIWTNYPRLQILIIF